MGYPMLVSTFNENGSTNDIIKRFLIVRGRQRLSASVSTLSHPIKSFTTQKELSYTSTSFELSMKMDLQMI